jgi:hypothetical protein
VPLGVVRTVARTPHVHPKFLVNEETPHPLNEDENRLFAADG